MNRSRARTVESVLESHGPCESLGLYIKSPNWAFTRPSYTETSDPTHGTESQVSFESVLAAAQCQRLNSTVFRIFYARCLRVGGVRGFGRRRVRWKAYVDTRSSAFERIRSSESRCLETRDSRYECRIAAVSLRGQALDCSNPGRARPRSLAERKKRAKKKRKKTESKKNSQARASTRPAAPNRNSRFGLCNSVVSSPTWTIDPSNALEHVSCGFSEHARSSLASSPVSTTLKNPTEF